MKKMNATGKQVLASTGRSQYDTEAINLLKDKQYLAWILKECTSEFAGMSRNAIMAFIETPLVGTVPVEPGLTNTTISGDVADSKIIGEGVITYDIRFTARLPKSASSKRKSIEIRLLVDVELQKEENPGYSLISRGVLYTGRMLSEQMGRDVTGKNYDALQKVYSIWICMNSTPMRANTISGYAITHNFIHGSYPKPEETDLLHLIVIRLPKEDATKKPKNEPTEFMKLLSTLLSGRIPAEEKLELIQKHGIVVTDEMKERVNTMCNLSQGILEEGLREGRKEGALDMLVSLVKNNLLTIQVAAQQAGITEADFQKILTKAP